MKLSDHVSEPVHEGAHGEEAPAIDRLIRVARAVLDMPIVLYFGLDESRARLLRHIGLEVRNTAPLNFPAWRLRRARITSVPRTDRSAPPPELGLFPRDAAPRAMVSVPIRRGDLQSGALLLCDTQPRDAIAAEALQALEDLVAIFQPAPCAGMTKSSADASRTQAIPRPGPPPVPSRASANRARRRDTMTGLVDGGFVRLEAERRVRNGRSSAGNLAFALVSLDRFRRVNDSLGHNVGDVVLRQVAQRLSGSLQDGELVGRRSGDEFIILMENVGPERLAARVHQLQAALREPFHADSHELMLTASVGVASYPQDSEDIARLLRYADIALHRAKDDGIGRIRIFDASMLDVVNERLEIEAALREAMRAQQLSLVLQPKYLISSRELIGAEALLRWTHPTRGPISPARFIPLAEDSGLIVPIGTWALNEVCRICRKWLDRSYDFGRISVNVSGHQFMHHDFAGTVKRAILSAKIPAEVLEIELTETMLMGDADYAIRVMGELRDLGVRISIDDFGTGYSSLAYLQKLPVDVLKIDRSFVTDLDREGVVGEQARSLLQAITFLGHQLHLEVLAEGVETSAQLEQLANVGCDEVQGYLFGKPMKIEDFERLIRPDG